jgi:hypothetical protein
MATPLRGHTLPAGVIAGTGFRAIVLAIPLNALLALDFTRTGGAFAFHRRFSFPTGLLLTVSSSLGRYEKGVGQGAEIKQPHGCP